MAKKKVSEKNVIREKVDDFTASDFGYSTLGGAIEYFQNLAKEYGPDAELDYDNNYCEPYSDHSYTKFFVYRKREETDAELAARKDKEAEDAHRQHQQDLLLLAALKKKLG